MSTAKNKRITITVLTILFTFALLIGIAVLGISNANTAYAAGGVSVTFDANNDGDTNDADEVTTYSTFEEAWNAAVGKNSTGTRRAIVTLHSAVTADATSIHSFGTGVGFGSGTSTSKGFILVPAGKYISLNLNGYTINRNVSSAITAGYVIKVNGNLTLTDSASSGAIMGGKTTDTGGGVYVNTNGAFAMNGGTISNNSANTGGGVYVNTSGTFTISNNAKIDSNTVTANGGGVYVSDTCIFAMTGGTISNNSAYGGGGVYIYGLNTTEYGIFAMNGGTISNNTAAAGGGVYVGDNSDFTMLGAAEISNNAATNGGGVYVDEYATFTMDAGTISNNTATSSDGGGVYVNNGATFTMDAGTISNNTASSGDGGGVYIDGLNATDYGTFTMNNNAEIDSNSATNGGGVYVHQYAIFTMNHTAEVINNTATTSSSSGSGGGVYVNRSATFTMNGGTISTNNATSNGGGVYIDGRNATEYGTFTMNNNAKIDSNSATNGGGVYVQQYATFTMNGGTISTNTAVVGGGVYASSYATFTMNDTTEITNNTATSNGGGVYVSSATFTMNGGTISTNTAVAGGGVYVKGSNAVYVTFTMTDGTISGNTATSSSNGGGVYASSYVTFTMDGGTISNNSATNGGGVYASSDVTFTMNGGTISNNSATNGGGVYVNSSATFTMTGGTISNNSATNGGGVRVHQHGTFTMDGGTISGNSASFGGGVYVIIGTFTMNGGTISTNTATSNGGGVYSIGIFNLSGEANITGNKCGSLSVDNNVLLASGNIITISDNDANTVNDNFSGGIGVTTLVMPAADNVIAITSAWGSSTGTISSDNSGYKIVLVNNEKHLTLPIVTFKADFVGGIDTKQGIPFDTPTNLNSTQVRSGYKLLGWATESAGAKVYDPTDSVTITDDITLYALWEEKATVTITQTAQTFTYDASAKSFAIVGTELGGFTIQYYVEGSYVETAPTNAGSYNVKVTRAEDADYLAFEAIINNGLVINPKEIDKPTANSATFTYDGTEQTYTLPENSAYTISGNKRTVAGSQDVTVALTDKANYVWSTGGTDDVTFTFTIGKKDISNATITLGAALTYNGTAQTQIVTSVTIDDLDVTYTIRDNTQTNHSTDDYTLTVTGNGNFIGTATKSWNIAKAQTIITVNQTDIEKTYGESWSLPTATSNFGTVTCDKTVADMINAGSYIVTYSVEATDNYLADSKTVNVIINKATPITTAQTITAVYGQTLSQVTGLATGYTLEQDGTLGVGTVSSPRGGLTATFTPTDTANYEIVEGITVTLTVSTATITAPTANSATFTYDGTEQTYTLPENSAYTISSNKRTVAGSQDVTVALTDKANYVWSTGGTDDVIFTFAIDKATVTKPTADATVFVADGTSKTYAITANSAYTVNGNVKTDVGVYTVTVALTDSANYKWADGTTTNLTFEFVIRQAQLVEAIDDSTEKEDVIVTTENGFAPNITVSITIVEQAEDAPPPVTLEKNEEIVMVYDVKLLQNEAEVQPDGRITIKILIPAQCVGKEFRILHIHGEEVIEMPYNTEGDYAIVTTDRLSEFVFVADKDTASLVWLIILLAILIVGEVVLALLKILKAKQDKTSVKTYSFMPLLLAMVITAGQIGVTIALGVIALLGGLFVAYLYLIKGKKGTVAKSNTKMVEESPSNKEAIETPNAIQPQPIEEIAAAVVAEPLAEVDTQQRRRHTGRGRRHTGRGRRRGRRRGTRSL